MTTAHETCVDDQLIAAAADLSHRVSEMGGRRGGVDVGHHPTEVALAEDLAAVLSLDMTLCQHLTGLAPQRLGWTPGTAALVCSVDLALTAASRPSACDICSTDVEPGHGRALFTVGPIAVAATLCADCKASTEPPDLERLRAATRDVAAALQNLWTRR